MKKWFAFSAIFLSSYIVFLLASAPLALVVNNIKLPRNIEIQGISGTVWQGEIAKATINNSKVENISTSVSFWSLFSLAPSVQVSFGDAMLAGPEGKFTLKISTEQLALTDLSVFVSANTIASQLPLPIPIAAKGNAELNLKLMVFTVGK